MEPNLQDPYYKLQCPNHSGLVDQPLSCSSVAGHLKLVIRREKIECFARSILIFPSSPLSAPLPAKAKKNPQHKTIGDDSNCHSHMHLQKKLGSSWILTSSQSSLYCLLRYPSLLEASLYRRASNLMDLQGSLRWQIFKMSGQVNIMQCNQVLQSHSCFPLTQTLYPTLL